MPVLHSEEKRPHRDKGANRENILLSDYGRNGRSENARQGNEVSCFARYVRGSAKEQRRERRRTVYPYLCATGRQRRKVCYRRQQRGGGSLVCGFCGIEEDRPYVVLYLCELLPYLGLPERADERIHHVLQEGKPRRVSPYLFGGHRREDGRRRIPAIRQVEALQEANGT